MASGKPWWRAYAEAANDPKLLQLSLRERWAWFCLMCAACSNGGKVASDQTPKVLRLRTKVTQKVVQSLLKVGLIEQVGDDYVPHNWQGRQYLSDYSTPRVQRFRNVSRNAIRNGPDTDTEQSRVREGASRPSRGKYFFEQGAIRLTEADYRKWQQAFNHLDLNAELVAMEPWASKQANWFQACSALLGKHNAAAKVAAEKGTTKRWRSGIEGVV